MRSILKRTVSMILALVMIFTMLPVSFADEPAGTIAEANPSQTTENTPEVPGTVPSEEENPAEPAVEEPTVVSDTPETENAEPAAVAEPALTEQTEPAAETSEEATEQVTEPAVDKMETEPVAEPAQKEQNQTEPVAETKEPVEYTVIFYVDGDVFSYTHVLEGNPIGGGFPQTAPEKDGYEFTGWFYRNPTLPADQQMERVTSSYIVVRDMNVNAGFKAVEAAPAEEPAAGEPVVKEPVEVVPAEEPIKEQPAAEEPAAGEPVVKEPAEVIPAEEPIKEQPAAGEPVVEEPAEVVPAEEPIKEQPAAEEPAAGEPVVEVVLAEEPVTEVTEMKNGAVTVNGLLPVGGSVQVTPAAADGAKLNAGSMKKNSVRKGAAASTQSAETETVETKVLASYDITIEDAEGNEWPLQEEVSVTVSLNEKYTGKVKVYHYSVSDGNLVGTFDAKDGVVTFPAKSFSVYIVTAGETVIVPRLTVQFMNGETELATMYVKEDDTAEEIEKIIYDPGAGTVPAGQSFKGWTTVANYTKDSAFLTIDEIRAAAEAATITADQTITYYAAIFKQYTITYVDAAGITVGSAVVEIPVRDTEAAYTVNQGYTTDDSHNFEGWKVSDGSTNIVSPSGVTADTLFPNGTEMTIKGNIKFSVIAPEGHWLVFDENGKGATYNAPRFIKDGEVTSDAGLLEMVRNGYIFGGWYTDAACTDGNEFDFGGTISETTIIYAKWTSSATANYTVLIWKQNVAGNGYDFVESVVVEDATVGSTPNAVNTTTGRVNGATYNGEDGFSFKETDQASKTVAPEGNTVVNVYWDRNEYTLTFQIYDYTYTATTSNNGTQYGLVDGQYVVLTRHGRNNYYWTYGDTYWDEGPRYTGTRYTRNQSWQTIKTITALYGADIRDNFPIVGTNGITYTGASWSSQNSSIFDDEAYVSYIDTMQAESTTFHLAYNPTDYYYTYHVKYYVEALPGDTDTVSFNGKTFVLYHDAEIHFQSSDLYSTESEEFTEITGYTKFGSNPAYEDGRANFDNNRTISLYYTRNLYSLNFMDGAYYDGNGNRITDAVSQSQLREVDSIAYGASLTDYNAAGASYYEPTAPEGYVFEGWYIDDACTHAYTFTTMAEGGITVYAKWRQIQYRVFLHPNAGTDTTLTWGSETQAMNFRVSYGGKISVPTGKRTGYEFYGWYTDAACTQVFTANSQIRGGSAYDKNTDFTDPMDKWGNGATYNSDTDRFWITEKVDLYAKWSAVTVGADGIGIFYDANGGSNAPSDTALYKDNTSVTAAAAATAPEGKHFSHWVLQTWNGSAYEDTTTKVLPGATFTALKSDAKITDASTGAVVAAADVVETEHYKYTIQLKAVYVDVEEETPTHIIWYKNDGTDTIVRQDGIVNGVEGDDPYPTLKINEAVTIPDAPSRDGYTFKGWAKSADATTPWITWDGTKYSAAYVAADEREYEDLYAVWEAQDVKYHVEYYFEQADGTYTKDETLKPTAERTAKTDTTVEATSDDKTSPNTTYVFNAENTNNVLSATVAGDGSTVLKVYFKLNMATVTVHHYLKGTTTKVAEDVTSQQTIGTEYTASPVATYQEKDLTVDSYNPSQEVTVVAGDNVITIYYTLPLTITAKTDSKAYDGTTLTGSYTLTGALASDEETIRNAISDPLTIGPDVDSQTYQADANAAGIPSYYVVTSEQGKLTINPLGGVTIKITGHTDSKSYNGREQYVFGYDVEIPEGIELTNDDLTRTFQYWVDDSTAEGHYVTTTKTVTKDLEEHTAKAGGRNAGTYPMGLAKEQFACTNENYTVTFELVNDGEMEITKVDLKITVEDQTYTYNGEAQGENNASYTNAAIEGKVTVEGLVGPDSVKSVTLNGQKTDAGVYEGEIKLTAFNLSGQNVTVAEDGTAELANYNVTIVPGKLTITPKAVTIRLWYSDGTYQYNGEERSTSANYSISLNGFMNTDVWKNSIHPLIMANLPKGTDVGEYHSELTVAQLEEAAAADPNYDITFSITKAGTLTITKAPLKITVIDQEYVFNGNPQGESGEAPYTTGVDSKVTVEGLAGGDTLSSITLNGQQTNVGEYEDEIVASDAAVTFNHTTEKTITDNYDVEYVPGTLTITAKAVTIKLWYSDGTYQYNGEERSTSANYSISLNGFMNTDVWKNNIHPLIMENLPKGTDVGEYHSELTVAQLEAAAAADPNYDITFSITKAGTLTITKAPLKITVIDQEYVFNGNPQGESGEAPYTTGVDSKVTVEGLAGGDTLSSITLNGQQTNVGEYEDEIVASDAAVTFNHTTEKTITDNYEVTYVPGKLTITKADVTVTIQGKTNTIGYNGTLRKVDGIVTENNGLVISNPLYTQADFKLKDGEGHAEGTNVLLPYVDGLPGKYYMGLTADSFENLNQNFNVTFVVRRDGWLMIMPVPLTITAKPQTYTYNGSAQGPAGTYTADFNTYITISGLQGSDALTSVTLTGSQTDAATYTDEIVPSAAEVGDATGNYIINYVPGTLTINPLGTNPDEAPVVTITEHSGTYTYDGTAKTVTGYDVSIDNDLYKEADFTFSGNDSVSGTNAGTYEMELKPEDFTNKNPNFANVKFVIVDGQLVINPLGTNPDEAPVVTITGNSATEKYNGSEQTVTGYDVSIDNELYKEADFTFSGDATVKGTDAGSYEMELKAEDFANTNPNFVNVKFVIVDGTLEISKRTVTLTSASGTKMFDGTPIRRNNPATHITVGGDGFVSGEGATYTITGVQTDVGQSNNTFTYALNANTKAENYTITQTLGRLMILPEEVPLGLIGSVSMLFMSDTNLTAEGKKADAYKETYKWIKENNPRLGALAIIGTGNAVADRNDEDAWKLIKDELDGLERQPGYLPYYNIAGRNEVNGDEMDYETYLKHDLNEVSEWNRYEDGQIWYQPYNEQQLLLVGIGYQKIADPETATQEELDAQEAWLRYVNNVVARYPDYTVVLLVNDFIEKDPEGRADEGRLTAFGELVEDRIVRINDNIALILCGNAEGTARWDKTYGERNVNAIMYNYSNDEENGLGFFRIVTLNGEAHTITVTTYSPTLDKDSYDEEHPEYDFYVINDAF